VKWIYPYRTLFGDTTSRVVAVKVDDEHIPTRLIDADRQEVALVDLERSGWETAHVTVGVVGPKSELRELADDRLEPTAIAVLHCGPTNARVSGVLEADEHDPSHWYGTFDLSRDDWFGKIIVRGFITARVDSVEHRIIGSAPEWILHLDDVPRPPVHGAITIKWENFGAPDEFKALRRYEAEPAFLHLDPAEPVLYLNRGFDGLEPLLRDRRGRRPGEQALHDQTRATIAAETWAGLFNAALQAIDLDDEDPDWPASDWQRTALELLLDRMYDEKGPEDALREVVALLREADGGPALQERLLPAVSVQASVAKLLRASITRLGADLGESEENR
jgi:hypothetical protein